MHPYRRRQAIEGSQAVLNKRKLEVARGLVGKKVLIDGAPRVVTGYSLITGEAEVRVGLRTNVFDPLTLAVVEGK